MITFDADTRRFHLAGDGFSHVFRILETGQLECLHFGARLDPAGPFEALERSFPLAYGSTTAVDATHPSLSLDLVRLEASPWGRGDYREPSLIVEDAQGDRTSDFRYTGHRIVDGKPLCPGVPGLYAGNDAGVETLEIDMEDRPRGLKLTLRYSVFPHCDAEVRWVCVSNSAQGPARLLSVSSLNADFGPGPFTLTTLDGAWIREYGVTRAPLVPGAREITSRRGVSSAAHAPFLLLEEPDTTETSGNAWAFTLVYSGNHRCRAEVSPHGLTRVQLGLDPLHFSWTLAPGESFESPEAVVVLSDRGRGPSSAKLHTLVRQHLVRGPWRDQARPLLANTWESFYFQFNAAKLVSAAQKAKDRGLELFVVDDGWFGKRDDDTSSLGDWIPDPKKLPRGLRPVAEKIKKLGLLFGIWVEPEMVSQNSDLARSHPDWIVQGPSHQPSPGRNQQVLDLTRPEVRTHLVDAMTRLLSSAPIDYVKWDMNRNLNDLWSPSFSPERQGEFAHRWVLGLYDVVGQITTRFPGILFENCASGGNRSDWGMLAYFHQTWLSDDTDAAERPIIQHGASFFLPPSVWGAHVSAGPNHQVLRRTSLEARFDAAAFGLVGYELDLAVLTPAERTIIDKQVLWYKDLRLCLQFGTYHRLVAPGANKTTACLTVSSDKTRAVAAWFGGLAQPNVLPQTLVLRGLDPGAVYKVEARPQATDIRPFGDLIKQALPLPLKLNGVLYTLVADRYLMPLEAPVFRARGDLLMTAGLPLTRPFHGTGAAAGILLGGDFTSQIFVLTQEVSP